MHLLKAAPGAANLRTMVATSPTSRLLNLHGMAGEAAPDSEFFAKPMFVHTVLNRSIIAKHNVRPGDEARLAPRQFNATKIIFPFDSVDLGLGGQYLFVDQEDFVPTLTRHLEYGGKLLDRDLLVLRVLDGLPTLDPFLVREVLAKHRIEVDPAYFRFNEPDKARMMGFVEHEIESLIELCFGEVKANDSRAKKLSQLLLADADSPDLQPLQLTLRMDGPEFAEAMFAWKAFLYYRWRTQTLAPSLKATARSIARINRRRYDTDGLRFVIGAKEVLEETVTRIWREVGQTLKLYDRAYEGLTHDRNPENFRRFLLSGRTLFIDLGERIGKLEQLASFWDHRLTNHHNGGMSPDDVMDALRDLLQGLSIWPRRMRRTDPDDLAQARVG
jgi:hypothetical protein